MGFIKQCSDVSLRYLFLTGRRQQSHCLPSEGLGFTFYRFLCVLYCLSGGKPGFGQRLSAIPGLPRSLFNNLTGLLLGLSDDSVCFVFSLLPGLLGDRAGCLFGFGDEVAGVRGPFFGFLQYGFSLLPGPGDDILCFLLGPAPGLVYDLAALGFGL